ncbi:MAG: hypothetical protein GX862_01880 [Leucobacter sp.]|nr:hypothetical protein [Leucobacter sp.]
MITWFATLQIVVAALAALLCLIEYSRKRTPNDYTLGATLLVGILLIAQVVVSIIAPLSGNTPTGDLLEFWMYLITALILPFGAAFWALIDRRRSALLVLLVVNLAVAVMVYRMLVIWQFGA